MADKPILFSGPMVRALLAGTKTQTRRIVSKPPIQRPDGLWDHNQYEAGIVGADEASVGAWMADFQRIQLGDRLYVRETWQGLSFGDYLPTKSKTCDLRFAATDTLASAPKDVRGYPWRPGIHMPRWASRITLTVTDVRVERLQDISDADALAEGVKPWPTEWFEAKGFCSVPSATVPGRTLYAALWDQINGAGAWSANPWVVAYTFTVEHGNIDQLRAAS